MGNGESTYDDASQDGFVHEPPSYAGTSMGSNHPPKRQSTHIADNFNSLDQV